MIKSMTGYGRAREVRNKRDITVEVPCAFAFRICWGRR